MFELSRTSEALMRYLHMFGNLSMAQIREIFPEKSELGVANSVKQLSRMERVNVINDQFVTDLDKNRLEPGINYDMNDAAWIVLSHITTKEELELVTHAQPPALLCYLKDNEMYYILSVPKKFDVSKVRLFAEQMMSRGTEDVRLFVIVPNADVAAAIPEVQGASVKKVSLKYPDSAKAQRPEIIFYE